MTLSQNFFTRTHSPGAQETGTPSPKMSGQTDIQEQLAFAMRHHSSGDVERAGLIYRQILQLDPRHADALHLLGLVLHHAGQNDLAEDFIRRAIAVNGSFPGFHSNLGIVLHAKGKLDDAVACYRRALKLQPEFAGALSGLASTLVTQGKLHEAIRTFKLALKYQPDNAEINYNLGNAFQQLGRNDQAGICYGKALSLRSDYAEAHYNLGNALRAQGKLAEAEASFRLAVNCRPDYVLAYLNLGVTLIDQGKLEQVEDLYRRALSYKPDYAEAHNNLGNVLRAQGRLKDAITAYQQALACEPDLTGAHNNLGIALKDDGQLNDAVASFERAMLYNPADQEVLNNLGTTLCELGQFDAAVARFLQVLELQPDCAEAYNNLGFARRGQGFLDEAITCFRQAISYRAEDPIYYNNLGVALAEKGATDEAIAAYHQALSLRADYAEAYNNLGSALAETGALEQAAASFKRAVSIDPQPQFFLNLSEIKRFSAGDSHLLTMETLSENMASNATKYQIDLHFALGKAYDDCGNADLAFQHFRQGNSLKRQSICYDEDKILRRIAATPDVFNADMMARLSGYGHPSRAPIFIIGMPRSGSTLVEQILASHAQVDGGGERPDFPGLVQHHDSAETGYPEAFRSISTDMLNNMAATYLGGLLEHGQAALKTTDKLLGNFLYAGLIHLVFPNAKIIHTRRDPVDTCLSCFFKLFRDGLSHTYDLGDLGRYYRAYSGLMAYWRHILPASAFIEVDYEVLVANFEEEARRLIALCDLPWDPKCLSFYETKRVVRTASLMQVRQPIYTNSVGRGRGYGKHIGPLLHELGLG